MSEFAPNYEEEPDVYIDRIDIVSRMREIGFNIHVQDFDDEDDEDFLGAITGHAAQAGLDFDEFYAAVGVPVAEVSHPE